MYGASSTAMEEGRRKLRVKEREREERMVVRRARLAFSVSRAEWSAKGPEKGVGFTSGSSRDCLENLEVGASFQF